MAVHTEQVAEMSGGFSKSFEESAITMIMDNVQRFQYQYPEKSTIRELVSNGVDATREKFQALAILQGMKKEEDYYIRRDDAMFRDSNFNPEYFDPAWLDAETNVRIEYHEGGGLGRDRIVIKDHGVGLGGKRLDGYFKLGWSSKRNSTTALGKFGIGAKAALSTGVDYYTVVNRYNGQESKFNVYSHKVDSVTPKLNMTTGQMNPYYMMYEGTKDEYIAYWTPTTQPNGVEVIVEVKKHKKQQYIDAVKAQLLYFDNVELWLYNPDGHAVQVSIQAKILFENDNLIVSDQNQYSKPHLVIGKVNYGYIDFQELELEQKVGNVGIKVAAEDVTINPSRESVIWDEMTKTTIVKRFKQAAEVATELVQAELKTTDFWKWLRMWSTVKHGRSHGNSVLGRMSSIIDLHSLEPTFPGDPLIKAGQIALLFPGLSVRKYKMSIDYKGGKQKRTLDHTDLHTLADFDPTAPVYFTEENLKPTVLRYLSTVYQNTGFYVVRWPKDLDMTRVPEGDDKQGWIEAFSFDTVLEHHDRFNDLEFGDKTPREKVKEILVRRRKKVVGYVKTSEDSKSLDKVKVPDDFNWTEDDKDDVVTAADGTLVPTVSAEERRKLEQRVVAFTPRGFDAIPAIPSTPYNPTTRTYEDYDPAKHGYVRLYEWQKVEPRLSKVQSLSGDDIYYGTSVDEKLIHLAAAITTKGQGSFYDRPVHPTNMDSAFKDEWGLTNSTTQNTRYSANWGPKAKVTLLKVAQDQVKHYKQYRHINEFFMRKENGVITMSTALVKWHTARIVHKELTKLAFLQNYAIFDQDKAAKYQKLKTYVKENYKDLEYLNKKGYYFSMEASAFAQLADFQSKVMQLQLFVREHPEDKEAIAAMSKALVGQEAEGGVGIDLEIWDALNELLDYASPVSTLLNEVGILTQTKDAAGKEFKAVFTEDQESEIRSYIAFKGL